MRGTAVESTLGVVYELDFADFDETEFEEFCFELLRGAFQAFTTLTGAKGPRSRAARQTVAVTSPPRSITSTSTERDTSKRGSWTANTTSAEFRRRLSKGF
jgi:hypothetical protein